MADADGQSGQQVTRSPFGDEEANGRTRRVKREPHCDHGLPGDDEGSDITMVHAAGDGRSEGRPEPELRSGRPAVASADASGVTLGDAIGSRLEGFGRHGDHEAGRAIEDRSVAASDGRNGSYWSDHEWLICHDGKARRTQPGTPLLVDGLPGRVGLWRVAGNAISPILAAEVIGAFQDEHPWRIAA